MDLLYAIVLLCTLYFLFGNVIVEKAKEASDDLGRLEIKAQYPALVSCIDVFPDENKVYKELCYRDLRTFLDVYKTSFLPDAEPDVLIGTMDKLRLKIEEHQREMIFRLPNDLVLHDRLEASTELMCMYLKHYMKDVDLRWMGIVRDRFSYKSNYNP